MSEREPPPSRNATSATTGTTTAAHATRAISALQHRPRWTRAASLCLVAALILHGLVSLWMRDSLHWLDPQAKAMSRMKAAYTRHITLSEPPTHAAPENATATQAAQAVGEAASAAATRQAAERARRERARQAAQAQRVADAQRRAAAQLAAQARGQAGAPSDDPQATERLADAATAPASAAPTPPSATPGASSAMPAAMGASATGSGSGATAASPNATASGPAFSWPVSTRIRYQLIGWYRGEVRGDAQVEWLREGDRYQVHLDVRVGAPFAPLMTRRMSSAGRVTPTGLVPERYEQETKQVMRDPRLVALSFDANGITLADGRRVPPVRDIQDTASQFIQMIYLFSTRPELREAGRTVEIGLAFPNRADRWVYDVGPTAVENTPAGPLEAFHVTPRRAAQPGDLGVEMWFAPRLGMMPIRFRIRQDANIWVDLFLEQAPEQAGP